MNAWVITIAGGIRGTRVVWSRVESLSAAQLLIEQHFDPSDDAQIDYDPDRAFVSALQDRF